MMDADDLWTFLTTSNTAEPVHNRRYLRSYEWIAPYLTATTVLEVGQETVFTRAVRRHAPSVVLSTTGEADLRYALPLPNDNYDLVLCMEVVEHVKDRDPLSLKERVGFTASGIRSLLSEAYRVLKAGGVLFLTTPNVCSYYNLQLLLAHQHPYMYQLHHRELSPTDVQVFLREAGYDVLRCQTPTVWGHHGVSEQMRAELDVIITRFGFSTDMRGDCLFVLAQKPNGNSV